MYTYKDAFVKLKYRLNKSATEDYSNIDKDAASEAINKAFNDLIRRLFAGRSQSRESAEETTLRVDDLQALLTTRRLSGTNSDVFFETIKFPKDYKYYNRISIKVIPEGCTEAILIPSDLREESNVDELLSTDGTAPSLEFEQCFNTLISNKTRVYHNNDFTPLEATLTYYREHKKYDADKPDEVFELKDDVVELIIDEAAKIIAGDTNDTFAYQKQEKSVENNN